MTQKITIDLIKQLRELTGIGMNKCKEALEKSGGNIEEAITALRKEGAAQAVKKEGRETKEGVISIFDHAQGIAVVEVNAETDFVVKNEHFQAFAKGIAQEALELSPTSTEDFLSKTSVSRHTTIDAWRLDVIQTVGENVQVKRVQLLLKKPNHSYAFYSHLGGKIVAVLEISGSASAADIAKEIAIHVAASAPEYLTPEQVPAHLIEHEKEIARAQVQNKPANVQEKIIQGKLNNFFDQICLLRQPFIKDASISIEQLLADHSKKLGSCLKIEQFIRWKVGS